MSDSSNSSIFQGAQGGRVWVRPTGKGPIPGVTPATGPSINSIFTVPSLVMMVIMTFVLLLLAFIGTSEMASPDSPKKVAYEQEYGYSSAEYGDDHFEADVVTMSGEKKTVGYLEYEGYEVFYENKAQLMEKIDQIEAGTYPVELKDS